MKATARLCVNCRDAGIADQLSQVLSPDNVGIPRNQRFSVSRSGRTLAFEVESEDTSSSFSTLLSILADTSLFQEIWLLSREGLDAVGGPERD